MMSVACAQEEDKAKRKAELTADYEEKMAAKKAMREEGEEEEEEPEDGTCMWGTCIHQTGMHEPNACQSGVILIVSIVAKSLL